MGSSRRIAAIVSGTGLACALAILPASASAAPSTALGGVVRDALGGAIAGAEVLVLPDRSSQAVGSAITDEQGRFRILEMPAGLYRVAALKPGYLATVTRANTFLRSTVEVVLRPIPHPGEIGSENVTARPTWILRAPPRSILRETELRDIVRAGAAAETPARESSVALTPGPPPIEVVEGQFRHLVALGSNTADSGGRSGPIVGGETTMQLTSALGQRGSLRFSGRRENLETSRPESEGSSAGSRSARSLAFDVRYDTSRDTSLDVSAYFAEGDVRMTPAPAAPDEANREARRAWGYDATWTKQLDQASRVAVSLGYRDASLDLPGEYLRSLGFQGASQNLSNRAIGATGSYEVLAGDNHLVRVGARAQLLDLALPVVRDGGEAMFVALPGGAGWSVRVDAEDAWSLSAPWTVLYGIGVQQVLEGPGATLVVPRTGAVWSPGRVHLRMLLSYHAVAAWGDGTENAGPGIDVAEQIRPARPLGWETELEVPVAEGLSLRAGHRYEPLRDATRAAGAFEPAGDASLVVRGGRAADRSSSISLTRQSGRASTSFGWTWGEAEGLIAQSAGFELPIQILADRTIAYRSGRVDIRFPETTTEVAVEYRRFEESPVTEFAAPFVNSYVEVAMGQQVARVERLGATCRVLLAARFAPGRGTGSDSAQAERARSIAALNQRVSAGLLVTF